MIEWITSIATVVNVGLVFVLVWVTREYMKATRDIVRETVKDREVRRIGKALEGFYYPLMQVRNLERYRYPPRWGRDQAEIMVHHMERLEEFWAGVKKHQYLAERGPIKVLDSFFEHSNHYWVQAQNPETKADLEAARRNLIAEVKKDIKALEERLGKLYG